MVLTNKGGGIEGVMRESGDLCVSRRVYGLFGGGYARIDGFMRGKWNLCGCELIA